VKETLGQRLLKWANKPTFNRENIMSKKSTKDSVTTAIIEEKTAAFLKAGGAIQYIVKGRSGHTISAGQKQLNPKKG
jgi:hypothetical protein